LAKVPLKIEREVTNQATENWEDVYQKLAGLTIKS